jgi:hypothetical protein
MEGQVMPERVTVRVRFLDGLVFGLGLGAGIVVVDLVVLVLLVVLVKLVT